MTFLQGVFLCAASFVLGRYAGDPILAALGRASEAIGEWIVERWTK